MKRSMEETGSDAPSTPTITRHLPAKTAKMMHEAPTDLMDPSLTDGQASPQFNFADLISLPGTPTVARLPPAKTAKMTDDGRTNLMDPNPTDGQQLDFADVMFPPLDPIGDTGNGIYCWWVGMGVHGWEKCCGGSRTCSAEHNLWTRVSKTSSKSIEMVKAQWPKRAAFADDVSIAGLNVDVPTEVLWHCFGPQCDNWYKKCAHTV